MALYRLDQVETEQREVDEVINLRTPETPLKKLQETVWLEASSVRNEIGENRSEFLDRLERKVDVILFQSAVEDFGRRVEHLEDITEKLASMMSRDEGADAVDDEAIRTEMNIKIDALERTFEIEIENLTRRVDTISGVVQNVLAD